MSVDAVRRSLIVSQGTLIRVYPASGDPYWIRDRLIGTDDPDQDVTHWAEVVAGRLSPVKTMVTTDDQYDVIQQVIDSGMDEARANIDTDDDG